MGNFWKKGKFSFFSDRVAYRNPLPKIQSEKKSYTGHRGNKDTEISIRKQWIEFHQKSPFKVEIQCLLHKTQKANFHRTTLGWGHGKLKTTNKVGEPDWTCGKLESAVGASMFGFTWWEEAAVSPFWGPNWLSAG